MEAEILREIVADNRELEQKLTKKNEQYIFDLKKSLRAANLSEEAQALALQEILPELVAGQKSGRTARQLFGTVSERTQAILEKPEEKPESTPFWMWLDNTLLLFGVLTIMTAVMMMLSKGKNQPMGLLTCVFGAMVGGYSFYLLYKYIYQYDRPGVNKANRPGWLKTGAIVIGSMLLLLMAFTATMALPPAINPVLDPVVSNILGGITFGARYLLKKKYNMHGSFTGR